MPALSLSDSEAGILFGGTIYDVAQVVGAGHLISDEAATVATYVKLMRVAMLVPVVMLIGWVFGTGTHARGPALPSFLIAFVLLAGLNSLHLVPAAAVDWLSVVSRWCLVCAIAALGMKTSLEEMTRVGWRSIALVVAETLFLLGFVLTLMTLAR